MADGYASAACMSARPGLVMCRQAKGHKHMEKGWSSTNLVSLVLGNGRISQALVQVISPLGSSVGLRAADIHSCSQLSIARAHDLHNERHI